MWLEAALTRDDLFDLVHQFSPLEFRFADSGSLTLTNPTDVSLSPSEGIVIVCDATLHYPILGIAVPVAMKNLTAMVLPAITESSDGSGETLIFRLRLVRTGVSLLPSAFDDRVTKRINDEIVKKHVELGWNFRSTLAHTFALPAVLASAASIGLDVTTSRVTLTESTLAFTIGLKCEVQKRSAAA